MTIICGKKMAKLEDYYYKLITMEIGISKLLGIFKNLEIDI